MADITGNRFGMLTVLQEAESRVTARSKGRIRYFRVRCDCGTEKSVQWAALRSGVTKSCGCLSRERSTKHGMEGTKVYAVWSSMKARCQNARHRAYKNYGGRGISVCERWQKFENFYADMGEPTGVLDRIDNDGDYTPTNCRWTTWSVSNTNKRHRKAV
jgi:hypothetical protein